MRRLGGAWVWGGVVAAAIGLALYGRAAARDVRVLEVRDVAGAVKVSGGALTRSRARFQWKGRARCPWRTWRMRRTGCWNCG